VKFATRGAAGSLIGVRAQDSSSAVVGQIAKAVLIAAIAGGFIWLVGIYSDSLRDPRYLDGWVLAGGMVGQLSFHFAIKTRRLSPKYLFRWRKIHIFLGYLLIATFLSHSQFSLPDSSFGWALWSGFALVTLSGLFGTYLAWSLKSKGGIDERFGYDRIPSRIAELAQDLSTVVAMPDPTAAAIALPVPPYQAWIADLYANQLRGFFGGPRNFSSHLIGSQRSLKRLMDEINDLSPYVDAQGQEKLSAIANLVTEKDRLDFARVHLGLTRAWLFIHVPITYGLIVLSVLHVLVVYSYSSGTL
jgi:hypothetical protein